MLTRIRNANVIGLEKVLVPKTKINLAILKILREEGFIDFFEDSLLDVGFLSVGLKVRKTGPYISFLKRISKPGLRVYVNSEQIPRVWGGIGIAIFTLRFIIIFV